MAVATTTAIALGALALTAAGTGVAVSSSLEQAAAAEKAGKFNEQVAQNNAIAAQQQAQFEARQVRKHNLVLLGKQRAAVGKSGTLLSGSAAAVIDSSVTEAELDRLATLYTGRAQSSYYRTQGQLAGMEANQRATAARYQAAGSLLTGLGNMAGTASNTNFGSTRNNPTFTGSSGSNRVSTYDRTRIPGPYED